MLHLSLVLVIVVCAALSVRTRLLLIAALWLAVTSAAVAALLYALGAREIAVIELSVGTGLVPVLFVFAVSLMGKGTTMPPPIVSRFLAITLIVVVLLLLGLAALSSLPSTEAPLLDLGSFSRVLWDDRGLDMLVQSVLIFAGVLSVLNLLSVVRTPVRERTPAQTLTSDQPEGERELVS
jgi:NADH:ubiquinone oxidoreductase subunit 6 (subunit J)